MNFLKRKYAKKLKFEMQRPDFLDVVPAKTMIPKWYKDTPAKTFDPNPFKSATGKACIPFLDSFTTGYTILLPVDIMVTPNAEGGLTFGQSDTSIHVIGTRDPKAMPLLPIPKEYDQGHHIWSTPCALELPSGYSMLVTHPINRMDLPFTTLSGVIDDYKMSQGSLPVMIKKGFAGLIPAGTPIAQIIPFKREDWVIENKPGLLAEAQKYGQRARNTLVGYYKRTFWKKKNYD
jgi:hypothetical protein